MIKHLKLIVVSGLMIATIVALWLYPPGHNQSESVHYHAGFRVYIDDHLQDYSGYQFMNYTPCQEHDEKKSAEEEQLEKAHLHDSVGDVVHVHRDGALWGDLFKNIGVFFPEEKSVMGYIDGVERTEFLSEPIEPYTTLIVSVGETEDSRREEKIERGYIEEVEAKSELCGT